MLKDRYDRVHDYLRISLTDRCNLRCNYCMPEEDYEWTPAAQLMSADEIVAFANIFQSLGVHKIRLTGGEPLARVEFPEILRRLDALDLQLAMTTNGLLIDRYFDVLQQSRLRKINVSLDTLQQARFLELTRRDKIHTVLAAIDRLVDAGFSVKVNVVAMRGVNGEEVNDFVRMTIDKKVHVRFIEFMPFDGNRWQHEKVLTYAQLMETINHDFEVEKLTDKPHSTAKKYQVKGAQGTFAIISTVTQPFCSTCNRMRLTADGQLRNCLFSTSETDLLTPYRNGVVITELIRGTIAAKQQKLGGLPAFQDEDKLKQQLSDRSMIKIGG